MGLGQGYQPVAGFNWGAGNYARVKTALVSTIAAGAAFTTAAAVPGFVFAEDIVSIFAGGDARVVETGTLAMRWAFAGFPFIAFSMIANMTYQVLGRAKAATFLSSLRQGWVLPAPHSDAARLGSGSRACAPRSRSPKRSPPS